MILYNFYINIFMRNKSAFTKPVIQNSFRKSSRIYPKSISIAKNDIGVY